MMAKAKAKIKEATDDEDNNISLKDMLLALDKNSKEFYNTLSDGQKDNFSPWLAMRYSSSVSGKYADHYLVITHEIVNKNFSVLNKHPQLQWQLLSLCGVGSNQFHAFIPPGKKKTKNRVQQFLSELYPTMKLEDLAFLESINTTESLKQKAQEHGYTDAEITEIFKG